MTNKILFLTAFIGILVSASCGKLETENTFRPVTETKASVQDNPEGTLYEIYDTNLVMVHKNLDGCDVYEIVVTMTDGVNHFRVTLENQPVDFEQFILEPQYDVVENGLWTGSGNIVPTGAWIRYNVIIH